MRTTGRIAAVSILAMLVSGCRALPDTALSKAVVAGETETVRALVAAPGAAGEFGDDGMTALHWAARTGQTESMRILVQAGAPLNLTDYRSTRWTPMLHAIHKGQSEAVGVLLELGADPNARAGGGGMTPLIMAAGYGQTATVRLLLAAGADPRAEAGEGINALWSAAGGAAIADLTDGPSFGSCQPETIAVLREAAPDLRIPKSLSAALLSSLSRSEECSRLLEEIIQH